MPMPLDDHALDQLFRTARTRNGWTDRPVAEAQLRELHDLVKFGPTAANACPARFVWVRSAEGKARLAALASEGNRAKILAAPVTVIVGHDLAFADRLEQLNPGRGEGMKAWFADPAAAEVTAFRNGCLQGAYLMIAARALGLDCGPMSGFDNDAVDAAFFAGTRIRSNFICGLGYGSDERLFPRQPRLSFDEAGWLA
jgi:3-hydroxypropanoate dehydrogenase